MLDLLTDLTAQHDELESLLAGLDAAAWTSPTPLPGWSVADVVLHLAQTDETALASLDGRLSQVFSDVLAELPPAADVDDLAGLLVAAQRGTPPAELLARWQRSSMEMRDRFAAVEPTTRVEWVAGTMTARTLAATRLSECWIHTTDVAAGLGVTLAPTARLRHIVRLVWRTFPYAFERAGHRPLGTVDVEVTAPDGSTWAHRHDESATVVRGPALDLCRVAGQRAAAADTALTAQGPDADAALRLARTFA